jgi:hypothetical protein
LCGPGYERETRRRGEKKQKKKEIRWKEGGVRVGRRRRRKTRSRRRVGEPRTGIRGADKER